MPALLTSTSSRSSLARTAVGQVAHLRAARRSRRDSASAPVSSSSRQPLRVAAVHVDLWPAAARSRATARPRPSVAPVTRTIRLPLGQLLRVREHLLHHAHGQAPGERVLLRGVEAAEQGQALARQLGAVPEARLGPGHGLAQVGAQAQGGVPGKAAQAHDDAHAREQLELALGPGQAVVALGGRGAVGGRRAAHRGGQEAVDELQAVVGGDRRRLVGEPARVQGGEEPVARAVAGEHAAGAVGAVGGGRQAEQADARVGVAEAGHGAAPVLLVGKRRALLPRHLLAPLDEPRAATAVGDLALERLQVHCAWLSAPRSSRSSTGSSSRTSAGRPRRTWRAASSAPAAMTAKASARDAKPWVSRAASS